MSAETLAYSTLSAAAPVTALVGTRIYPDFVPQEKTLPALAIARAETEYINSIHSNVPLGSIATLGIWCMAATRAEAEALADVVVTALSAFTMLNRSPEFDADSEVLATVLTVSVLE
jgi:hypothetical protein